ncbi:MAG: radical SAM protein [Methanobrevibacter millerae]|uniref:Radical SAM protein n=1 Tax=Methanobrevibacter millerae TaxID=230361 RepID=A0A8T3VK25_9EURY|nr:radical SAM protein [Methanobrevibacter millerae]MBE6505111.1 radical SAM protein [Methanobrevibacter millerae]
MIFEDNIFKKDYKKINIRFALTYPNIYKTAMSSLGYNILYNFINERDDTWCERVTYPNVHSIESNTPLKNFDIISFSLQFEEDYFNVLEILKKSDIPLKRSERSENDPLIIAGGPCATANPMPLSDYIDVFIIGEGEVILNEFLDKFRENRDLNNFLDTDGIYIPEFDNNVKIALVENMDDAYHITDPIITKTDNDEYRTVFSDSIMLNVSRGCTRGCRFCMSSYLYRPIRETNIDKLVRIAIETRKNTRLNKITLIGAAVSDYSKIESLIKRLEEENFQISTPSLRIESITYESLKLLKESGLKTITLAPESIDTLRKRINKDIPDEKIFSVIEDAVELDFNIKLYFLIGLPYETMDDIKSLCEYIEKIAKMHTSRHKIKFSINPVVPKPHTPLQWVGYNFKDLKRKSKYIKKNLRKYNIKIESPKKALIQYILSCGNSDISTIIEKSLTKNVTLHEWMEYLPEYDIDDELPWDNIDIGVKKEFLKIEYKRLESKKQTPWCEKSPCYNCGACKT